MSSDNPSILSHISVGTADLQVAQIFYDAVLATLGCRRLHTLPLGISYGKAFPEFWVQAPLDGKPANVGNGSHAAFIATSVQAVQDFYEAALKHGGTCDGKPGPRPDYGPNYYGCFVRDRDGHKIEATFYAYEEAVT